MQVRLVLTAGYPAYCSSASPSHICMPQPGPTLSPVDRQQAACAQ
jgi:hypothetical protein